MQQFVVDTHLLASSCLCPHIADFKDCWMDFLSSLILEKKLNSSGILLFTGHVVDDLFLITHSVKKKS
jgi:hypothetical protein